MKQWLAAILFLGCTLIAFHGAAPGSGVPTLQDLVHEVRCFLHSH